MKCKRLVSVIVLLALSLSLYCQDNMSERDFMIGEELFNKEKYKEALPYLENAAKLGNHKAQFLIGKSYNQGLGVEKNYSKALEWYRKAAEQGNAKAMNNIGAMYMMGAFVQKNESEGFRWFLKAAEGGFSYAKVNVGNCYLTGKGVNKNKIEARKWYEQAANEGEAGGQLFMGLLYIEEKNYKTAETWLLKSAEQGNSMAMFKLGSLYKYNYGTFKDLEIAAQWYKKSADMGNFHAQYQLGSMYYKGEGVKRDYKVAAELIKKSAEKNYADAQCLLGYMYQYGQGVSKNLSKAVDLYKKAAEKGLAEAQYNLGVMYHYGLGVNCDENEAAWMYRKAAEQGYAAAQYWYGYMCENGEGVMKNISEAIEWYKKALESDSNNQDAFNALNRLGIVKAQETVQESPQNKVQPSQTQESETGPSIDVSGTGFVIDKRGYLATNYHVTKGAKGIYVCLQKDGIWKLYHAVLVKNDQTNDLSIIRIEDANFKPFSSLPYNFTTNVEEVASEIYTLGYPQVHIMGTEVKYTTGSINSKSGIQGDPTHYQISAHIDHGNSGGPMFNSKGSIIGITDSGLDKAEYGDVNYAIKSSYLKSLVDALPVKIELPHDKSIERLSRVEQIKILSKYTALILIDLP